MPIPNSAKTSKKVGGVVRGVLAGISEEGDPMVDFAPNVSGAPMSAPSTTPVTAADVGREAVLMFEDGDIARPILLGLIESARKGKRVVIDGEQLTVTADREIVLRCGEASITLTRAGKVIIRGAYVVSRSSGANRIKGACVQIN
jgi:hypothetical protein